MGRELGCPSAYWAWICSDAPSTPTPRGCCSGGSWRSQAPGASLQVGVFFIVYVHTYMVRFWASWDSLTLTSLHCRLPPRDHQGRPFLRMHSALGSAKASSRGSTENSFRPMKEAKGARTLPLPWTGWGREGDQASAFSFSTEGRASFLFPPTQPQGVGNALCTHSDTPPTPDCFLSFPHSPALRIITLSPLKFKTKSAHFSPHFPVGLL